MSDESPQKTEDPADDVSAGEDVAGDGVVLVVEGDETPKPITIEQAKAEASELAKRIKNAGLSPLRIMATDYLNKTLSAIEGFLGGLEGDDADAETPKKKKT